MVQLSTHWIALLVLGWAPNGTPTAKLPSQFTLGQAVPKDCWLYLHYVPNEEREWLKEEWREIFAEVGASGILEDVMVLLEPLLNNGSRDKSQWGLSAWRELIGSVNWRNLFAGEVVFAERLGAPLPDYLILTRTTEESAESSARGLATILEVLAELSDKASVTRARSHGAERWSLSFAGKPEIRIELIRRKEVVALVTGHDTGREILALLSGSTTNRSILSHPRFRAAIASVHPPEDSISYFDYVQLLDGMNRMVGRGIADSARDGARVSTREAFCKATDVCAIVEYTIISTETQRLRELSHSVTKLNPTKCSTPLYRAIFERRAFERFDAFVPADARSFWVDGFIDLGLVYRTVLDFVETNLDDGPSKVNGWKALLQGVGIDLDRDLFSWWSGELVQVSLPTAVATPFGGDDSVWMIRTKDAAIARDRIDALIEWGCSKLTAMNQGLLVTPVDVGAEGFVELTYPVVAVYVRPVIGVTDQWIVVGTSADAVRRCLAVASGKAPSIRTNPRFRKEGITPKGPCVSASYSDLSNVGAEAAQMAALVGTAAQIAMARASSDHPGTTNTLRSIRAIIRIVMKLGPILHKLDFYRSSSLVSTIDDGFLRTEGVITYQPRAPRQR